jgi:hypothetical protein
MRVSAPLPPFFARAVLLTEISLCHACSCHAILRGWTRRGRRPDPAGRRSTGPRPESRRGSGGSRSEPDSQSREPFSRREERERERERAQGGTGRMHASSAAGRAGPPIRPRRSHALRAHALRTVYLLPRTPCHTLWHTLWCPCRCARRCVTAPRRRCSMPAATPRRRRRRRRQRPRRARSSRRRKRHCTWKRGGRSCRGRVHGRRRWISGRRQMVRGRFHRVCGPF